ncbi:DUF2357 domain-containing protein [Acidimicrobiales bacterium]|nr:DUF2357 domain-containing protein [Acidimicrobiales bacterium]
MTDFSAPLHDGTGAEVGRIELSHLKGQVDWNGIPTLMWSGSDTPTRRLQLLEESEYEFTIHVLGAKPVALEPAEILSLSSDDQSGRVRPGRRTGTVQIDVDLGETGWARAEVDVRSRKLDYESEYRWMFERICREGAELAQSAFAPSRLSSFKDDTSASETSRYNEFERLRALVSSESFHAAVEQLRVRPYTSWRRDEQRLPVGLARPSGRSMARSARSSGSWVTASDPSMSATQVPQNVVTSQDVESTDNPPNQFVRFAVEGWIARCRELRVQLAASLSKAVSIDSARRATKEIEMVEAELDRVLSLPAIRDAGRLQRVPFESTVLQRRAGYREFLEAFVLSETSASVAWDNDDLFGAGVRDVATLYEYWVFLEIARILQTLPDLSFDAKSLTKMSKGRIEVTIRRDGQSVVSGRGIVAGREVVVELWFNRQFPTKGAESWTVTLRPDCSLLIRPAHTAVGVEETWVHFDAKYRVQGVDATSEQDELSATRADIHKMHAYRDAIRRSAGSFVIYPGNAAGGTERFQLFDEIVPGIGAISLRPTGTGEADAATSRSLAEFINEVMTHSQASGTRLQRHAFWGETAATGPSYRSAQHLPWSRPPADTGILFGYVKSPEHWAWIWTQGEYNLRADPNRHGFVAFGSPELNPHFVVLYDAQERAELWSTSGDTFVRSGNDLTDSGYPSPGGDLYAALALGDRFDADWLAVAHAWAISHIPDSAPRLVPGDELLLSIGELRETNMPD